VSNHLRHLDIVVLSSFRPCVLVAKQFVDEVCYWRDMTLVHLLNLFTKWSIDSHLTVASFSVCGCDRKELARKLSQQIVTMRS